MPATVVVTGVIAVVVNVVVAVVVVATAVVAIGKEAVDDAVTADTNEEPAVLLLNPRVVDAPRT